MRTIKRFEAFKGKPIKPEKIQLDLHGPEGNAFNILSLANKLAKRLDYTKEEIEQLMDDMQLSDYDNLVQIFEDHFGEFVDIYNFEPKE